MDTCRNDNIVITSKRSGTTLQRRFEVIMTLLSRNVSAVFAARVERMKRPYSPWVRYLIRECGRPLHWRHNDHDGVSNHQPHGCLLNRLFRRRSKKTSKLRVTGLCAGNSPGTGEFPAQMASNAEKVSIWWRHHDKCVWVWETHTHDSCTGFVTWLVGHKGSSVCLSVNIEWQTIFSP